MSDIKRDEKLTFTDYTKQDSMGEIRKMEILVSMACYSLAEVEKYQFLTEKERELMSKDEFYELKEWLPKN